MAVIALMSCQDDGSVVDTQSSAIDIATVRVQYLNGTRGEIEKAFGKPEHVDMMAYTYPETTHMSAEEVRQLQRSMPDEMWRYSNGLVVSFSGDEAVDIDLQADE